MTNTKNSHCTAILSGLHMWLAGNEEGNILGSDLRQHLNLEARQIWRPFHRTEREWIYGRWGGSIIRASLRPLKREERSKVTLQNRLRANAKPEFSASLTIERLTLRFCILQNLPTMLWSDCLEKDICRKVSPTWSSAGASIIYIIKPDRRIKQTKQSIIISQCGVFATSQRP